MHIRGALRTAVRAAFTLAPRPHHCISPPSLWCCLASSPHANASFRIGSSKTMSASAAEPAGDLQQRGEITYLSQTQAQSIDEELMSTLGFSIDQLMELAGLSVAHSVAAEYSPETHRRVLVLVGPGNNGGDGLVAARHLRHMGYTVLVCYPTRDRSCQKPLYAGLVTQCESLDVKFVSAEELLRRPLAEQADIVLDALFGFSFKGTPRPPFDALIAAMCPPAAPPPVAAVDIPSGWDVEAGDTSGAGLRPDMLISLTAPKRCAAGFSGRYHYLGGRFVPPAIADKYSLRLPPYPGTAQCVRLGTAPSADAPALSVADMRLGYGADGSTLDEQHAGSDPMALFESWFEAARGCGLIEPNAMALATASPAPEAAPSLRFVLLKGFDARGIVWYTNYDSRKGEELGANPQAAATFWWEPLQRSVRFEGRVERVAPEESDAYWDSRPRGHQVGGLVSRQSRVLPGGRAQLEEQAAAVEAAHAGSEEAVPRPEWWGGYRLRPKVVEYWQGRPSRLHDRLRFRREGEGWALERLSP